MHLWKAFLWGNQQLIKKHVNTKTFENLLQTVVLIFLQNTNYIWQLCWYYLSFTDSLEEIKDEVSTDEQAGLPSGKKLFPAHL